MNFIKQYFTDSVSRFFCHFCFILLIWNILKHMFLMNAFGYRYFFSLLTMYVIIKIKVLCPRSGSHRKVKQNDKLRPVQDSGSLAVFKVTARDQCHYKGGICYIL